ncbi:CASPASE_P20 domain-containing protein [Hyphomicrobiales bacterium]|nr:CASPASE_P20 domain-containing protein [Hyphomicrobiales bacterium]CAH1697755.1 CASPASE_P20 domain-containing protein [Hyphomicrobiales bacterium]CAI0347401.1 CASPASE_P20 domain-containing protein [Hyphomicrobiales bacterium]
MSFASLVSVFQVRATAAIAFALWVVALAAPVQAALPERRVALVIGNSAYTAVPPLANPERDAKGVSAALKRLGFEVVEGYDLKMAEMTGVVREFAQKLDGAKAGLVYYAGHGIAVGDENYLIPVDASLRSEADLDFRAVNVQLVLRQMQRDERVNIVILDACRDNPFAAQLAAKSRAVTRGLTPIETQTASGILIAFATDPRATALDGDKDGNSPFTAALLKHIETPEVSITTVMDRVRADVWEATGKKQKPWTNSSIIGEFKLNPTLKLASVDPAQAATKAIDAAVPVPALPVAPTFDRAQLDVKTWEVAERGNSVADYRAYLDAFPTGQFASFARNRLASLEAAKPAVNAVATPPAVVDEALKQDIGTLQTEAAMKLSAKDFRELQTRLRLSGFQPGKPAASFGPAQRKAIQAWQKSRGIPETGFLTAMQATALNAQSEPAYRRLLAEEQKAAAAKKTRKAVVDQPEGQGSRSAARTKTVDEGEEMYRRDLARERGTAYEGSGTQQRGTAGAYRGQVRTHDTNTADTSGAAAFGSIVGGAIMGGILRGR